MASQKSNASDTDDIRFGRRRLADILRKFGVGWSTQLLEIGIRHCSPNTGGKKY